MGVKNFRIRYIVMEKLTIKKEKFDKGKLNKLAIPTSKYIKADLSVHLELAR